MELTTALFWTLRVLVPIILFCIYFRLQAGKDEQPEHGGGGASKSRGGISRERLLRRRWATLDDPVPEELSNLTLKTAAEAPSIFGGGRERPGPRPGAAPGRREERPKQDRRERPAKESAKERPARPPAERKAPAASDDYDELPPPPAVPAAAPARAPASEAPSDDEPPAAVPLDAAPAAEAPLDVAPAAEAPAEEVPAEEVDERPEEERQLEALLNYVAFQRKDRQRHFLMDESSPPPPPKRFVEDPVEDSDKAELIVRGALKFRCGDVLRDLCEKLEPSKVEEVLQEVVDLGVFEPPRAKLSRDAPIFVPTFGVAATQMPPKHEMLEEPVRRTPLTAAARPFEPQFTAAWSPAMTA